MVDNPVGFWARFGAILLDGLIIGIPLSIISYLIVGNVDGDIYTGLIEFLYYLVVPVLWSGYTIGKKILGIRIVKLDGSPPTFGTMLVRVLVGGLIYAFTLGIAVIVSAFMIGLRQDKRAIHDFIAGTYVKKVSM
jgi:uncharacterized RDD family membrane protein YckC